MATTGSLGCVKMEAPFWRSCAFLVPRALASHGVGLRLANATFRIWRMVSSLLARVGKAMRRQAEALFLCHIGLHDLSSPTDLLSLSRYVQVSAAGNRTLLLRSDGKALAIGDTLPPLRATKLQSIANLPARALGF